LASRDPEGSQLLLLPLRLLRQSLITYLRDTVQNPYLLHPHNRLDLASVKGFRVLGLGFAVIPLSPS
jgi:hypothetical protein